MKALRFSKFGPPSVLTIEDVPRPNPRDGEALIQVKAAGINPSDVKNVLGHFPGTTLPRTPGRDFSGVVVEGKKYKGQEVWCSGPGIGVTRDGAHAEYVTVPEEALSLKPSALSMEQAASIGVPFITAWSALAHAAELQAGETILIVGAAGAVGQADAWLGAAFERRGHSCDRRKPGAVRPSEKLISAALSTDPRAHPLTVIKQFSPMLFPAVGSPRPPAARRMHLRVGRALVCPAPDCSDLEEINYL